MRKCDLKGQKRKNGTLSGQKNWKTRPRGKIGPKKYRTPVTLTLTKRWLSPYFVSLPNKWMVNVFKTMSHHKLNQFLKCWFKLLFYRSDKVDSKKLLVRYHKITPSKMTVSENLISKMESSWWTFCTHKYGFRAKFRPKNMASTTPCTNVLKTTPPPPPGIQWHL